MKFAFAPIGILAGLAAGFAAQKAFDQVWSMIDDQDPPEPDNRNISYPKLIAALALQGALFRVVKGLVDHGTRAGFERMSGAWPGDDGLEEG